MIHETIARWHQHVHGANGVLDDILADDVVFYSPVVYTPQRGKAIAKQYLTAAVAAFAGPAHDDIGDPNQTRATRFVYTKQIVAGDTAVLEFETTMDGKYVNGVDIIRVNDAGRIVEFRVMIRPLQALNAVHALMGRELVGERNATGAERALAWCASHDERKSGAVHGEPGRAAGDTGSGPGRLRRG